MKAYLVIYELFGKEHVDHWKGSDMLEAIKGFDQDLICAGVPTSSYQLIQCTLIK